MRYIKSWKLFEELKKQKSPKYKDMPTLYQDDNLVIKVVKTFEAAAEQGKNTHWCSNEPRGFHSHNLTANMYRFNFKDGYKLRLTWDYITHTASELGEFSGGTHWGQGGIVGGTKLPYNHIRPRDEENPFDFDYQKEDRRTEMVNRIKSIPEKAKKAVYEYQETHSKEKTYQLNQLYKEIEKIKVIDATKSSTDWYDLKIEVTVEYNGKKYVIDEIFYNKGDYSFDLLKLGHDFKKRYLVIGNVLNKYLHDKTMECIKKKNDIDLIEDIKYLKEEN